MNRIILAYSHHNAGLAQHIDHQLSRIGIPFEHASERLPGELASQISGSGEPAILLVTDNFLKDRAWHAGRRPVLVGRTTFAGSDSGWCK